MALKGDFYLIQVALLYKNLPVRESLRLSRRTEKKTTTATREQTKSPDQNRTKQF